MNAGQPREMTKNIKEIVSLKEEIQLLKEAAANKAGQGRNKTLKDSDGVNKDTNADSTGSASPLILFGAHFANIETMASDPEQATMAGVLKNLLEGRVQIIERYLYWSTSMRILVD